MMRMRAAALALPVLLAAGPTAAQTPRASATPMLALPGAKPFAVALVYDARRNRGPCAVTMDEYGAYLDRQAALDPVVDRCRLLPFEDGHGYRLIVLHPRFRADYAVTIVSQVDLGSGVIEPRGLATVTPLNLASLGVPVAHGGRQPSSVSITALTPAQVLEQLLDPTQMSQPLITLAAQVNDLNDVYDGLFREYAQLKADMTRLTGGQIACDEVAGGPTLSGLHACMTAIDTRITQNTAQRTLPESPNGCSNARPPGWTPEEFDCVVNEIDRRIGHLTLIRGRLTEYNFPAAADQIDTAATQLATKYRAYQQNRNVVQQALRDLDALWHLATNSPADEARDATLWEWRRTLIRKQLKDKYGTLIDDKELNDFATRAASTFRSGANARVAAISADLQAFLRSDGLKFDAARIDGRRAEATTDLNALATGVDRLNVAFAGVLAAINNVYLTVSDQTRTERPIDTSDKSGTNRIVFCKLTSDERFKLYQFAGVAVAAPAPAAGGGQLLTVAPNPAFTLTLANLPQNVERHFSIELHRLWHANIVGGFVFSTQRNQTFGVTSVVQNGQSNLVATITDDQRPTPHYLVGFNYYFAALDSFPGARTGAKRWIPGAMFGIGVESSKQFFVGPAFEPTTGITLSLGWHYGQQTELQLPYVAGQTPLPAGTAAAPTRAVMRSRFYVMFGFDLDVFRRFLGTVGPGGS